MANHKITAELLLSTDMKDVVREIDKGLSGALRNHAQEVKKTVGTAWGDAIQMALGDGRTGRAMKDFIQAGVIDAAETYNKLMQQGRVAEAQSQKELLDQRAKAFKREIDLRQRAFKEMQDRQLETAEQAADRYKGGAEKLARMARGDFSGVPDMARGWGHGIARRGRARQERAAQIQQAGGDPAQAAKMAKFGATLAKIGTALAAIAAVVGVVVVLVKLFADLESKIKDMNKALIDSAGAADFGFSAAEIRAGALRETLEELRNETTSVNENFMRFRVSAKEQQQILAQLNQAGYTYARMNDEIQRGSEFMRNFSDATALAITYSRTLGVSTGEIAQKMGDFAFETGMGLEDVAQQFSIISREAMVAGLVTKRFYAAIVEATSGMAFYGVRIEETTRLLKTFDTLLGEAVGTEAFKRVIGQYRDKGAQDRIRELIVKNQEFAQDQFAQAFERHAQRIARDFEMDPQEIRRLLSLDEVELTQALRGRGMTPEQIDRFVNARLVRMAATGDMGAMTRAMPFAGPGFDVAMAAQLGDVFGGKRIDEVLREIGQTGSTGAAAMVALEQISGKSQDELEKLGRAFTRAEADLRTMQDIAKRMQRGDYVASEEDLRLQEEIGQRLGLFIDKQGNIMRGIHDANKNLIKDNAIEIKDALQVIADTPTEGEEQLRKALTEDQRIATEISRNITGLNDIMEQTVVAILNDIYDVIVKIADWLFKDDPERQAELRFQERMAEESKQSAARLQELVDEQNKLVAKQERGEDLTKQEQERIKELPEKIASAMDEAEFAQDTARMAKNVEGGELRRHGEQAARLRLRQELRDPGATDASIAEAEKNWQRARGLGGVTPESELSGWQRTTADIGEFFTPGTGTRALTDRALTSVGATGWMAKQSARLGRAFGTETHGDLTDEEIEAIGAAAQRGAEAAYEDRGWFRDYMGIGTVSTRVGRSEGSAAEIEQTLTAQTEEQRRLSEEEQKNLKEGFDSVKQAVEASSLLNFFGPKKNANDLILPSGGGSPIITDERDTLYAARPGGPLASAMGGSGGRGGTFHFNIYGGDTRKIEATIMRVLKATGNA